VGVEQQKGVLVDEAHLSLGQVLWDAIAEVALGDVGFQLTGGCSQRLVVEDLDAFVMAVARPIEDLVDR
jgi:hypothetical protein